MQGEKMNLFLVLICIFCFKSCFTYSLEDLDLDGLDYDENEVFEKTAMDEYYGDIYLPYQFDSGVGNRENLIISNISVDKSFQYGNDVINWHAITFGGRQYLVGRKKHSVKLMQIKVKFFTSNEFNRILFKEHNMKFDGTIGPIVLTTFMNHSSGKQEGFALVTELTSKHFQSIHWLKITNEGLVHYTVWSNPIRGEIIDLKWIKYDFNEFLFIVTQEGGNVTIDISDYKLEEDKMRLMCKEKMTVNYLVSSVSIVVQGEDLYIMLVGSQQHTVWLYRYHLNINQVGGFKLLLGISSPGVTISSTFIQSGISYFLINGNEPNIYRLNPNGKLTPLLSNCGRVDEWLVLEVPSYRQDVILLAREGEKVSILTWKGSLKGFTLNHQPPCYQTLNMDNQSRISEDASCLALCKWSGAAVLNQGHVPIFILPCGSIHAEDKSSETGGLFHLNVSLHPTYGPAEEVMQISSQSRILHDKIERLAETFEREGLLNDIPESRGRLEEGWNGQWNGLDQCFEELNGQQLRLSSYVDLRHQNNVSLDISLQQGHIIGSASGLLANHSVQLRFNGKLGSYPYSGSSSDRVIVLDSHVSFADNQQFSVKARMNLNFLDIAEITTVSERTSNQVFGVSPEIDGPPLSYKSQEKLLHEISQDIIN